MHGGRRVKYFDGLNDTIGAATGIGRPIFEDLSRSPAAGSIFARARLCMANSSIA
jgi:hypothetical protein